MFELIERDSGREVYQTIYNDKEFVITYHPASGDIETVRPLSVGTDAIIELFKRHVVEEQR
ncbi:hypothetical protein [Desertibacillus haloalkaliphilus]|uniref:hypothetical protein n=1 Tax=Desertibacillus haloalkaliphilus TaxID=1328930 RepID=UPI001C27C242|nr:hypothetical protein [Desertibacillus haloalkaliphilus]MBU8907744.1 hypothetical protein [Desertibacillus haloalkaliphilus]